MKANYYADTDALYVELRATAATTAREIAPGVVVDLDATGEVVGIDVDWNLMRAIPRQREVEHASSV